MTPTEDTSRRLHHAGCTTCAQDSGGLAADRRTRPETAYPCERTSQAAHLPAHGHERAAASADSIAGGARPPSERRPLRVDEKGKRPAVCVGGPFGRPGLQLVRRIGARLDCGTAGTLATDALDAADVVTNRRAAAVMMAQCAGASSERSASCEHWGAASASEMQMSRRAQRQKDARSMPSRGSWAAE